MRGRGRTRSGRCDGFFLGCRTVSAMSDIGYILYTHRKKPYVLSNLFVGILWSSKCAKYGDKYCLIC